jgi:hypothetical protein
MRSATNPYRSRKPVTDPTQFYGRRKELFCLAEKFNSGQMCAISGEPLIGKTSLLYYLVHPEGARSLPQFKSYLSDLHSYLFVLIEMERLPTFSTYGVLRYVFDRVLEEAAKQDEGDQEIAHFSQFTQEQYDEYEMQRAFERYLKAQKRHVILLFDDFDVAISNLPKSDAAKVMQRLHALTQAWDLEDKLNCVFVSVDPLEQVLRINGFTTDSPLSKSITDYITLRPLDKDDVELFIDGPLEDLPDYHFPPPDVSFIKQLAGQHPAIIKIVCFYVFETRYLSKEPMTLDTRQQIIEKDRSLTWLMNTLWERIELAEAQEGLPLRNGLLRLARGMLLNERGEDQLVFEQLYTRGWIDQAPHPWILGELFSDFIQSKITTIHRSPFWGQLDLQQANKLLSPLEYKLYSYLVQNRERTCSRAELQQALWGDKLPTSRDALEQIVKRVREKIEPHPENPEFLLAVRGRGYLLRDREKD